SAIWRQVLPEQIVVPMLAGIVEHGSQISLVLGKQHDFLERLALERVVLFHKAVECGHIGLMMLAMMQLKRFRAHSDAFKRVGCEGKWWQSEAHFKTPDRLSLITVQRPEGRFRCRLRLLRKPV